MIVHLNRKIPQTAPTLAAVHFSNPNLLPKHAMTVQLSGHGKTVCLSMTLGRSNVRPQLKA